MTKKTYSWTKAAIVVTKIIEVLYIIASAALLLGIILVLTGRTSLMVEPGRPISVEIWGMTFAPSNVELYAPGGEVNLAGLVICMVYGSVIAGLFALGFHNIHKVLSRSQEETPFRWDNVRLLRRSGFLFLGTIIVESVFGLIALIFTRYMSISIDMELNGVIIGILVLCLSQIFAQGVQMQEDIDGLV